MGDDRFLSRLPCAVLFNVASFWPASVATLSRVSTRLHSMTNPLLNPLMQRLKDAEIDRLVIKELLEVLKMHPGHNTGLVGMMRMFHGRRGYLSIPLVLEWMHQGIIDVQSLDIVHPLWVPWIEIIVKISKETGHLESVPWVLLYKRLAKDFFFSLGNREKTWSALLVLLSVDPHLPGRQKITLSARLPSMDETPTICANILSLVSDSRFLMQLTHTGLNSLVYILTLVRGVGLSTPPTVAQILQSLMFDKWIEAYESRNQTLLTHLLTHTMLVDDGPYAYQLRRQMRQNKDKNKDKDNLQSLMGEVFFYRALVNDANHKRAIEDYTKSLLLIPDDPVTLHNRGCKFRKLELIQEALADFSASLRIDPSRRSTRFTRAEILTDSKHYDEALADYDHLLKINPGDLVSFNARKCLLDKMRATQTQ